MPEAWAGISQCFQISEESRIGGREKTELENVEIVGMVHGLSVAPEELAAFIKAFRGSKAGAPIFMEREGNENDGLEQKAE